MGGQRPGRRRREEAVLRSVLYLVLSAHCRAFQTCSLGKGSQASPLNATLGAVFGSFQQFDTYVSSPRGSGEEWSSTSNGCDHGCVSFNAICQRPGIIYYNAYVDAPNYMWGSDQADSAWTR